MEIQYTRVHRIHQKQFSERSSQQQMEKKKAQHEYKKGSKKKYTAEISEIEQKKQRSCKTNSWFFDK